MNAADAARLTEALGLADADDVGTTRETIRDSNVAALKDMAKDALTERLQKDGQLRDTAERVRQKRGSEAGDPFESNTQGRNISESLPKFRTLYKDFLEQSVRDKTREDMYVADKITGEPIEKIRNGSTIKLPDIRIGKSLGAKLKNYTVLDLNTGEFFTFAEGSRIQNVEVFAGKGTKKELRIAEKYAERYGGNPEDWQHVKGYAILDTDDGEREAEVHWMQCDGCGKHDFFVKNWKD